MNIQLGVNIADLATHTNASVSAPCSHKITDEWNAETHNRCETSSEITYQTR